MRSFKYKYFYSTTRLWCSTQEFPHRFFYNGKVLFYDGYILTDSDGNIIKDTTNNLHVLKPNQKYKLLSTIQYNDEKNFLGECLETGDLITFNEKQIKMIK